MRQVGFGPRGQRRLSATLRACFCPPYRAEISAHALSYEYINAGRVVDERLGAQQGYELVSPIPAYFLAMHGIELTLKAYLRHKGMTVQELRKLEYGHDLRACYRKAKELGLGTIFQETEQDAEALRLLMELNKHHGLRYIRTGPKRFPSWAIVAPLAVRLHQAIAPLVGYKTFT